MNPTTEPLEKATKAELVDYAQLQDRALVNANRELRELERLRRRDAQLTAVILVYVVCAAFMTFVLWDRQRRR